MGCLFYKMGEFLRSIYESHLIWKWGWRRTLAQLQALDLMTEPLVTRQYLQRPYLSLIIHVRSYVPRYYFLHFS
jgi:hypothetical protein